MDIKKLLEGKKKFIILAFAALLWFAEATGLAPMGAFADATPLMVLAGGAAVGDTLNRMAKR